MDAVYIVAVISKVRNATWLEVSLEADDKSREDADFALPCKFTVYEDATTSLKIGDSYRVVVTKL